MLLWYGRLRPRLFQDPAGAAHTKYEHLSTRQNDNKCCSVSSEQPSPPLCRLSIGGSLKKRICPSIHSPFIILQTHVPLYLRKRVECDLWPSVSNGSLVSVLSSLYGSYRITLDGSLPSNNISRPPLLLPEVSTMDFIQKKKYIIRLEDPGTGSSSDTWERPSSWERSIRLEKFYFPLSIGEPFW